MPKYKLYYFNIRGRAEVPRLIFAAAGQDYEDIRFKREEWPAHKPEMPFGQVPVLSVDGQKLGQSMAISRFLAKRFGLAGKTDMESARCDMVVDCVDDMNKPLMDIYFCKDDARKAELIKKYKEETLPSYLTRFETLLSSNRGGTGFFVGDELTWADLAWFHGMEWIPLMGIEIPWSKYGPKQQALKARIEKIPKIKEWIEKRPKTDM